MKKHGKFSKKYRWKLIFMSFLAAASMLYLASCANGPDPLETNLTALTDDVSDPVSNGDHWNETTRVTSASTPPETTMESSTSAPVQTTETTGEPERPPEVHRETTYSEEEIPYQTVYESSPRYYEGDEIEKIAGRNGRKRITTITTYTDGEISDVEILEEILSEPTDCVMLVGTRELLTYGYKTAVTEDVPYATLYEYDSNSYDDEKVVIQNGVRGCTTSQYIITYYRGVEISRSLLSTAKTEGKDQIIRVGTIPAYAEATYSEKGDTVRYTTIYEYDDTLDEGTRKVKVTGVNGYTERVYQINYYHGEEISRTQIQSIVHEPIDEVIVIGTKKTEETFGMPYIDAAHGGYDYNVTQYFGGSNSHGGIDFGVYYGNAIVSVMSGTVVYAYDDGDLPQSDLRWTYGTYVVIEHENGIRTYYAHMKDRTVSVGDKVSKGEVIGHSGNTGRVSPVPTPSNPLAGTHLHFEVRVWNGSTYVKTDPREYLPRWNY